MSAWEFVLAYLVAFVLIQLLVYRYLRGREDGGGAVLASGHAPDRRPRGDPSEGVDGGDRRRVERSDAGRSPAVEERTSRRCPACGAENGADQAYTFCRNCAARLPT